ncbi:aldehyde dehydrogenase [Pseudogracilibacillus sp. SE30717A]|uniref:aldehyde dehydrogenase n=1 Tax=Pseudogracilibacillus sp. SE30717A TaxID=3098293 RepID=UPI00300E578A
MKSVVSNQREFFNTNITKSFSFRKKQLLALKSMLQSNEKEIYDALMKDLNKSKQEAFTTELGILYAEINHTLKHLKSWMENKQVSTPLTHTGTKSFIAYEPYGVTLIISPWNYPLQLALAPTIGAIAAGNTVIIKPSELTPATSSLLAMLIRNTFDPNYITVIEGDKYVVDKLINEQVDYIFFTGSSHVGKIIMKKASDYLTPLTLELGGKSPTIVDKDANIKLAAKRIAWGKFTNAGQTCVAPDYVYVHKKVKSAFMKALRKAIVSLYSKHPLQNHDYARIINLKHLNRLENLLENSGKIILGGNVDLNQLKIEPTILDEVNWEDPIMKEEIFGPVLPILTFTDLDEVIQIIKEKEKPLALYYFGSSKKKKKNLLESVSFGGGCMNDTLYHLANPHLPFGGVGQSGMGAYHGKYSFLTFSHQKSILKQSKKIDFPVRYPNSKIGFKLVKRLFK